MHARWNWAFAASRAPGPHLAELALGGTAVGTGLNAHPEFRQARHRTGSAS